VKRILKAIKNAFKFIKNIRLECGCGGCKCSKKSDKVLLNEF